MSETEFAGQGTAGEAAPVAGAERIQAIDVLRGFAVLGILCVNIWMFAWGPEAFARPLEGADNEFGGANFWIWAAVHLFAEMKFISLFSVLFGAGMVMMSERVARGGAPGPGLHYRRQRWLLVIGLLHAYLIWEGDILVAYALCGFLLYRLHDRPPRRLLWTGASGVAVVALLLVVAGWSVPYWPDELLAEAAAEWVLPPEELQARIEAMRGGWAEQMPVRAAYALEFETAGFLAFSLWRAGGLMLVGMALYKLRVLTGERSSVFYRRMVRWGLGAGLPVTGVGIWYNAAAGFAWEQAALLGTLFNYIGSIGVFVGYVGAIMLLVRSGRLQWIRMRLAAVGRMALTNYITQSVLCSLIFYGHGLGLFASVGSVAIVGIVVAIWALQLAWSPWWLARFRFGPLEWLWRTLSYGQRQPMRIA